MKLKRMIFVFSLWSLVFSLIGCDAFVRKFTRKKKKEALPQEEMVLVPQEYKSNLSKDDLYRQYFLYWKSWQDELINALGSSLSHKKHVACIEQALKNLMQLRSMLAPQKQKELDPYLGELTDLRDKIINDSYGSGALNYRITAERLRMRIINKFSYSDVKGFLS